MFNFSFLYFNLYNKTRHSYIYIAGQTAEPIGLKFFCGHSWVARGCYELKKRLTNISFFFHFFPSATPGPSASYLYNKALRSYMLVIAGKTAGSNGLKYFEGTHWCPGSNKALEKFRNFIFKNRIFFKFKICHHHCVALFAIKWDLPDCVYLKECHMHRKGIISCDCFIG